MKSINFTLFNLFFLFLSAKAQFISTESYLQEQELQEALFNGEISFDQYQELLDLQARKVDLSSAETDLLFFVPDINPQALDTARTDPEINSGLAGFTEKKRVDLKHRFFWQYSFRKDLSDYQFFSLQNKPNSFFQSSLELYQKENSDLWIRRRALELWSDRYSTRVTLGNFDLKWGEGLAIGRHPYLNYSSGNWENSDNTFFYPLSSRFNGMLINSAQKFFRSQIFYSYYRFGEFQDRVVAANLGFQKAEFQAGIVLVNGEFKNSLNRNSFFTHNYSFYAIYKFENLEFSGEQSILSNKAGARLGEIVFKEKNLFLNLMYWNYASNFINPYGWGKADFDYRSLDLGQTGLALRSVQAGEKGVLFSSQYFPSSNFKFYLVFNQWHNSITDLTKLKIKTGLDWDLKNDWSLSLKQYFQDDDLEEKTLDKTTTILSFRKQFRKVSFVQSRFYFHKKNSTSGYKNSFPVQVFSGFPIFSNLLFSIRMKYYPHNYYSENLAFWNLYLQEKISLSRNHKFVLEYGSKFTFQNKV